MKAKYLPLFLFFALTFHKAVYSQEFSEKVRIGDQVILTASGAEGPFQWQESSDNITWTDIDGAVESSYTFIASGTAGAEKFFRAALENTNCGNGDWFYSPVIHHILIGNLSELEPGDHFRGGIAFNYTIDGAEKRIASEQDDTTAVRWGCGGQNIHTTYEDGQFNTSNIMAECNERPIAASVCGESELNGYADWHLPSDQELHRLNQAKDIVGGFYETYYWTSTEEAAGNHYKAWARLFNLNMSYTRNRNETDAVRCIRPVLSSDTTRTEVVFEDLPSPVSITAQPEAITVCSATPAALIVTADGTEPFTYQWFKNGEELTGFTQSTLLIEETVLSDEGMYSCEITNTCGMVSSEEAELKVIQLTIDAGDDNEFCPGTAYTLSASALSNHPDESGTLQYAWAPSEGLDAADILNPVAQPIGSLTYTLTVTDQWGCNATDSVHLTMLEPVVIETQPLPQQACPGEEVSFSVAASGIEPLSYQWLKNGEPIADETENTLALQAINHEDEGIYSCEITNACGTIASEEVALEVYTPLTLLTQPLSQNVCPGEELILSVEISGEEPISYQWKKDGTDLLNATGSSLIIDNASPDDEGVYSCEISNICGSITSTEAMVKVIILSADAGDDELICPGTTYQINATASSNHPEESGTLQYAWLPAEGLSNPSLLNPEAQPEETTTYTLAVTDEVGCVASGSMTLTLTEDLNITLQPSSQAVCKDAQVEFSVATEGGNNVSYQWLKDGQPVDNATENVLSIEAATSEDEGMYTCMVTHDCGSLSTEEAGLKVIVITADAGQDETICQGSQIQLNATASSNHPVESGDFTWLWEPASGISDPAIADPVAGPESNTDYIITATDVLGCAHSDTVNVQVATPWENQQICLASVDPASQKTQIMWAKTPEMGIEGFNIYRSADAGSWELAGYVPFEEPALFTDPESHPDAEIQKYSIAVVDTCGNESSASFYHSPVFLQLSDVNNPVELSWSHYDDEAGAFTPSTYHIYRGTSVEDMELLDNVPSTISNYSLEIQDQVYLYQIGVERPEECTDNDAPAKSYSNIVAVDAGTSVAGGIPVQQEIIISPNPFREVTNFRFSNPANEEFSLYLTNSKGQTVLRMTGIRTETVTLRGNDLTSGVYFIELRSSERILKGKMIVE